jgi:hypothetical protein
LFDKIGQASPLNPQEVIELRAGQRGREGRSEAARSRRVMRGSQVERGEARHCRNCQVITTATTCREMESRSCSYTLTACCSRTLLSCQLSDQQRRRVLHPGPRGVPSGPSLGSRLLLFLGHPVGIVPFLHWLNDSACDSGHPEPKRTAAGSAPEHSHARMAWWGRVECAR